MVSFNSIAAAAIAGLCIPAYAYPTNCDWLGCGLQTPLGETSHQKQVVAEGPKPSDIVSNLYDLTEKAQSIQKPAQSLSIANGPLIIIGMGPFPQIIQAYVDVISTATYHLASMQDLPPIKGSDADDICDAYRDFARVNEYTFNLLIGKAGLFSTAPFIGQPMAAVLRQLEGVYDTYAYTLINALQSRSADAQGFASQLDASEDNVIKAFTYTSVL